MNHKTLLLLGVTLFLATFILGCNSTDMRPQFKSIREGMNAQDVEHVLGMPDAQSAPAEEYWTYVEPFYVAKIHFKDGKVAGKVEFSDYEVDYSAPEYHD